MKLSSALSKPGTNADTPRPAMVNTAIWGCNAGRSLRYCHCDQFWRFSTTWKTRQTTKRNKKMSNNLREKIDKARMQIRMADNPLFCFDSILDILEEVVSEVEDLRSDLEGKADIDRTYGFERS